MEDRTELNTRINLWVAFDYGGRAELVEATRRIVESGVDPAEIDENVFAANLYAPELPDPDLLIRTSGELRISNFLLWQLAYSELVFVDKLWPDFDARELRAALADYAIRRRRFGGEMTTRLARRRRAGPAPVVLGAVYLGGWWLFALVAFGAAVALHEYWLLARPLAPLSPAGYIGARPCARRRAARGVDWMIGGVLTTFAARVRSEGGLRGAPGGDHCDRRQRVMGAVWIGGGLGFLLLLRDLPTTAASLSSRCWSPSGPATRSRMPEAACSDVTRWRRARLRGRRGRVRLRDGRDDLRRVRRALQAGTS